MGVFKSLGSKIKRVVSIKNLTRAITGDFVGIGQDAIRVASTNAPIKKGAGTTPDLSFVPKDFVIPQEVNDVLESQGKAFQAKTAKVLASTPVGQNVSDILTKAYVQTLWNKYKTWFILLLVSIAGFITYKLLNKKPNVPTKYRKKY